MNNKYKRYESPIRYEKSNSGKFIIILIMGISIIGYLGREQFTTIFKKAFNKSDEVAFTINEFGDTSYVATNPIPESSNLIPVIESKPPKDTIKIKKDKVVAKEVIVDTTKSIKTVINNDYIQPNPTSEEIIEESIKVDVPVEPIQEVDSTNDKVEEKAVKKRRFRLFKRRND